MAGREWNVAANGQSRLLPKSQAFAGTRMSTREAARAGKKKPQPITVGASMTDRLPISRKTWPVAYYYSLLFALLALRRERKNDAATIR